MVVVEPHGFKYNPHVSLSHLPALSLHSPSMYQLPNLPMYSRLEDLAAPAVVVAIHTEARLDLDADGIFGQSLGQYK